MEDRGRRYEFMLVFPRRLPRHDYDDLGVDASFRESNFPDTRTSLSSSTLVASSSSMLRRKGTSQGGARTRGDASASSSSDSSRQRALRVSTDGPEIRLRRGIGSDNGSRSSLGSGPHSESRHRVEGGAHELVYGVAGLSDSLTHASHQGSTGPLRIEDIERDLVANRSVIRYLQKSIAAVRALGLYEITTKSTAHDEYYMCIGASELKLRELAENFRLLFPLASGAGLAPFRKDSSERFKTYGDNSIFTPASRQQIIYAALTKSPEEGGCGFKIGRLLQNGLLTRFISLNNEKDLRGFESRLTHMYSCHNELNRIREYFGEHVAYFFAWLHFFTTWLSIPALIGLALFVSSFFVFRTSWRPFCLDSAFVPGFSVLLVTWTCILIRMWSRRESSLALDWNMLSFEENEELRDEFVNSLHGNLRKIDFKNLLFDLPLRPVKTRGKVFYEPDFPKSRRYCSRFFSSLVIIFMVAAVCGSLYGVHIYRSSIVDNRGESTSLNSFLASLINLAVILSLSLVFRRIAVLLTTNEMHRTSSQHEHSLASKLFLFEIANSYLPMLYLAFWPDNRSSDQRMLDLLMQLLVVLSFKPVLYSLSTVLLPWIIRSLRRLRSTMMKRSHDLQIEEPFVEEERSRLDPKSPFEFYLDAVLVYGYVVLFAAAFPLGAFFFWLHNLITFHSFKRNLLVDSNRLFPKGANSIGYWLGAIKFLTILSVFSNAGILCFTSYSLYSFYKIPEGNELVAFVGIEHVLLIFMISAFVIISSMPLHVQKQDARQKFLRDVMLREQQGLLHRDQDFDSSFLSISNPYTLEEG